MEELIKIDTRINIIYYQDENENIKERKVYQEKKVKVNEAKEILKKDGIKFIRILRVILEDSIIIIPKEELKKYIKKIWKQNWGVPNVKKVIELIE